MSFSPKVRPSYTVHQVAALPMPLISLFTKKYIYIYIYVYTPVCIVGFARLLICIKRGWTTFGYET